MTKAHEVKVSQPSADMLRWIAATMEAEQVGVAQVWDWSTLDGLNYGAEVGTKEQEFTGFNSNPLEEMALAKLIEGRANGNMMTIALTPLGEAWVKYQERGKVGKWSARSIVRAKATWALIAGIAVAVAFWIDLFNKVMEALRSLSLVP